MVDAARVAATRRLWVLWAQYIRLIYPKHSPAQDASRDAGRGLREQLFEQRLALLERPGPPVFAVELEQIERIEKRLAVMCPAMQLFEDRHAGFVAADRLAVDRGRAGPQCTTALRMSGYRSVQSKPLRVNSCTRSSRPRAIRR
jgi:hypothetical protein